MYRFNKFYCLSTVKISLRVKKKNFIPVNAAALLVNSFQNRYVSLRDERRRTLCKMWSSFLDSSFIDANSETANVLDITNDIENKKYALFTNEGIGLKNEC